TAIAWPIPDVPPVTRTPLSFRPGIDSTRTGLVVVVADMGPPIGGAVGSGIGSPRRRGVTRNSERVGVSNSANRHWIAFPREATTYQVPPNSSTPWHKTSPARVSPT